MLLQNSSSEDDPDIPDEFDCANPAGVVEAADDSAGLSQRLDGCLLDVAALAAHQALLERTIQKSQLGASPLSCGPAVPPTAVGPVSAPAVSAVVEGDEARLRTATLLIEGLVTDRSAEKARADQAEQALILATAAADGASSKASVAVVERDEAVRSAQISESSAAAASNSCAKAVGFIKALQTSEAKLKAESAKRLARLARFKEDVAESLALADHACVERDQALALVRSSVQLLRDAELGAATTAATLARVEADYAAQSELYVSLTVARATLESDHNALLASAVVIMTLRRPSWSAPLRLRGCSLHTRSQTRLWWRVARRRTRRPSSAWRRMLRGNSS